MSYLEKAFYSDKLHCVVFFFIFTRESTVTLRVWIRKCVLFILVNTSETTSSPRVRNLQRIISEVLSSLHHCVISDAAGVSQFVRLHLKKN